jgi:hypothetical protein
MAIDSTSSGDSFHQRMLGTLHSNHPCPIPRSHCPVSHAPELREANGLDRIGILDSSEERVRSTRTRGTNLLLEEGIACWNEEYRTRKESSTRWEILTRMSMFLLEGGMPTVGRD